MSDPLLEVEDLSAFYGQAQVLFDVSLTLRRGEVLALMGRNGGGKSTTAKAVIGLVRRRARRLAFRGQAIDRLPPHQVARLGLGYVPEERRVFADLTVAENLEVGRQPARAGRAPWTPERLHRIFPNLADLQDRRAGQTSGGEQQMLAIARTLMGNPDAVLLDEPSEGLAPLVVGLMAEAVLALKREGVSVLLCEQNLSFAAAVADRAIVIEQGHIRWEGSFSALAADARLRDELLSV